MGQAGLGRGDVTMLLKAWAAGDAGALDALMPLVYEHLHRMARRQMRNEAAHHTLQPTALVNEAFLRLADIDDLSWTDRAHFFAVAAQMMRRILVDAARARVAGKRGGGAARVDLNESVDALPSRSSELIALDDALSALADLDGRKARVVEMKFFGGQSVDEIAAVLAISPRSVTRDWRLARAWLMRELERSPSADGPESRRRGSRS